MYILYPKSDFFQAKYFYIYIMRINNYLNFITESKLELLLEAKMSYSSKFLEILSKIKSPLAKQILDLAGKDIDVNTNYIDIDLLKDNDVITFLPDNRVDMNEVNTAIIINPGNYYPSNTTIFKYAGLDMKHSESPEKGEIVRIVREFTQEEMIKIGLRYGHSLFWLKSISNGNDYFMSPAGFEKRPISMKSSDIKIGRFTKKLLDKAGIKVTDKDIEEFVNQFKAKVNIIKNALSRFKIVSGEDIRKYYFEEMYEEKGNGTLGGSCMRYERCQGYLDIYVLNPKQVSLIILMSDTDEEKISGRAILWTGNVKDNDDKEDVKFMDRAYTIDSSDETLFKEFAIKSGFHYKSKQTNDEDMTIMFNGEPLDEDKFEVTLSISGKYNKWPYMDTLKFYSLSGVISNDPENYDFKLEDTDGGNGECDTCGGSGTSECNRCDGNGEIDCDECDGRGQIRCDECSGEGHYDCGECEGSGEVDCDTCDGTGKDDEDNNCEDCDGKGKKDCSSCDGGTIECSECSGDGEVECSSCDGRGEVECYNCDGVGTTDCPDC